MNWELLALGFLLLSALLSFGLFAGAVCAMRSRHRLRKYGVSIACLGFCFVSILMNPMVQLSLFDSWSAQAAEQMLERIQHEDVAGKTPRWVARHFGSPEMIKTAQEGKTCWLYSGTPKWLYVQWEYACVQFEDGQVESTYLWVY